MLTFTLVQDSIASEIRLPLCCIVKILLLDKNGDAEESAKKRVKQVQGDLIIFFSCLTPI